MEGYLVEGRDAAGGAILHLDVEQDPGGAVRGHLHGLEQSPAQGGAPHFMGHVGCEMRDQEPDLEPAVYVTNICEIRSRRNHLLLEDVGYGN